MGIEEVGEMKENQIYNGNTEHNQRMRNDAPLDGFVVYSRDFGGNAVFGFEPVYLYVGSQPEGCGDDERSECIC